MCTEGFYPRPPPEWGALLRAARAEALPLMFITLQPISELGFTGT